MKYLSHPDYAQIRYHPATLKKACAKLARVARRIKKVTPFQAIAYRGSSGAAVAYPLSIALNLPVIQVRRQGETADGHGMGTEGPRRNISHYIIVDDFIASGNTVNKILHEFKDAECVAVLLYQHPVKGKNGRTSRKLVKKVPVWHYCCRVPK